MAINFSDLLGEKYAQLQQHADAATQNAASAAQDAIARARLTGAQADNVSAATPYVAGQAAANITQTKAQTGLTNANATSVNTLLPGQVRLQDASAGLTNEQAGQIHALLPGQVALQNSATTGSDIQNYGGLFNILGQRGAPTFDQFINGPLSGAGVTPVPGTPSALPRRRALPAPLAPLAPIAPIDPNFRPDPQLSISQ